MYRVNGVQEHPPAHDKGDALGDPDAGRILCQHQSPVNLQKIPMCAHIYICARRFRCGSVSVSTTKSLFLLKRAL